MDETSVSVPGIAHIAMTVLAAVLLSACDGGTIQWTEDVKLHDGKIVQLKRRMELAASGFPVQSRGRPLYHEFCYAPMGIHWKSKAVYRPELFDVVDSKAYAKVSLGDCARCKVHGYPETDALYFVWGAGAWRQIAYKEFPSGLRVNLLLSPEQANARDDAHGLVTLSDKERLDVSIGYELKVTGANGLNELPSRKGICHRCRNNQTTTDSTPEVFILSTRNTCE